MSNENVDPKIQIKEHVLEFLKELIRQELPTRASNHQETMADTDLLPPFAPPRYKSISSFFGNKKMAFKEKREVKTINNF